MQVVQTIQELKISEYIIVCGDRLLIRHDAGVFSFPISCAYIESVIIIDGDCIYILFADTVTKIHNGIAFKLADIFDLGETSTKGYIIPCKTDRQCLIASLYKDWCGTLTNSYNQFTDICHPPWITPQRRFNEILNLDKITAEWNFHNQDYLIEEKKHYVFTLWHDIGVLLKIRIPILVDDQTYLVCQDGFRKIFKVYWSPENHHLFPERIRAAIKTMMILRYMSVLSVEKFDISYQSKIIFKDSNLVLLQGRRYGLVAPNGSGKSTLLRYIYNREDKFSEIPSHFTILHVEEIDGDDVSALDNVVSADKERTQLLLEQRENLENDEKLMHIHSRLIEIEAYSAIARASSILTGLQFTEEMKSMSTRELSGGWRMRVSLARALFCKPTLLLLDEPTNHLDLLAVIWLESYLSTWKKTLLVASHDRDFLNTVCTDIIHINNQNLHYYKGDYDHFKNIYSDIIRQQRVNYEKQRKAGKKGMEKIPKDYEVYFEFPDSEKLMGPIFQMDNVAFAYPGKPPIITDLNFTMDMTSRIALVGKNGNGKIGDILPTGGTIIRNRNLRIGRFSQHFIEQLDMDLSPVKYLQTQFKEYNVLELRAMLGRFGLTGKTHLLPIHCLSGGQKSRVVIAKICMNFPHIILLDEPTNHLDIESIDALAESLNEFKGGVVLVSHNSRLISKVCNSVWIVGDNNIEEYEGDFEDYKNELLETITE